MALVMHKVVIGWAIYTFHQVLALPVDLKDKLTSLLDSVPPRSSRCSHRWYHLLVLNLRSMVPSVPWAVVIFTWLHHAINMAKGQKISLSAPAYANLNLWCHLVEYLTNCPKHLHETRPHPPTCILSMYASLSSMGGVWHSPSGEWNVWLKHTHRR